MLTLRPVRLNFSPLRRCSPNCSSDFAWMTIELDCNSDIGSPPLWKNGGSPVIPDEQNRANARYHQEMLDMVQEVSESNYELSMKDLVELSLRKGGPLNEKALTKTKIGRGKGAEKPPRAARKFSRSESMDRGVFLLKMFSPFPIGRGRNSGTGNPSPKGSPKPDANHKPRILDRLRTLLFRKSYSSSHPSIK